MQKVLWRWRGAWGLQSIKQIKQEVFAKMISSDVFNNSVIYTVIF